MSTRFENHMIRFICGMDILFLGGILIGAVDIMQVHNLLMLITVITSSILLIIIELYAKLKH